MGEKIKLITPLIKEKFSFVSTKLIPLCLWICTASLFGFSPLVFADGICDRTSSIQNAIVTAIDGVSDCNDVTPANLEEVLSLDLSILSLSSLDIDDFEGLVRLKTLDLSDNDLEELPTGLFDHAHLPLISTLYLHNNDLSSYDTLQEAVFLETLTIYGNPAVSGELFDDLHRFYNLNPIATSATSSVYGMPLLKKFLKDNEVANVEDFISALPDLYKERFSMVFDSEGLGADSVSGTYPRVISHGADADLLLAWQTNPDAEEQFKKSVEFLLQTQDSETWTAGVIDFSGDSPVIKQPESCSSCHGPLNKPLWGDHGVPNNNKSSGKGTEHYSRVDSIVYRQLEALMESSNSRIEPLDFSQAELTVNKMRAYEDSDIAVARELAQIISWSQIKVLFNILKEKPNYESLEQQILCATGGDIKDEINSIFSTADRHPAYLSHTLEAIQGGDAVTDQYNYNNYSSMEESIGILILYDLWERDEEFRDVYRTLSNRDMVEEEGSIPTSIHERHLMFKPSDTTTARDELLQALRLFFGHANRLILKERKDRRGPENRQISLHLAQVRPMAQKACTVLEEKRPFTVALEEAPERHDTNGFTVSVVFSRKIPMGTDFSSITATNASILITSQGMDEDGNAITKTENTRWEISLDPTSKSDGVTIVLASDSSCDDTICTADDTPLSNTLEIFVRGTKDPPTITSPSEFLVSEGETDVGIVTAIDDETSVDQLTWSISSGADQSHFTLSSDGALSFNSAKDFESPDDSDTDGTYELTVQVTDGSFSTTADLNITLQNVNEIPTITSPSEISVLEGKTAIAKLTATDVDTSLNQLRWSIISGADRSHFTLSSSGALSFNLAKDFESPDDSDTDGDYELTVRVSDGSLSITTNLNVTLQNINEAPIVDAGENQFNVEERTVVTLNGSGEDPENTTLSYTWVQTEGPNMVLSNQNTSNASFTAPTVSEDTTLRFSLTVTDAEGLSGVDYVSVQIVAPSSEDEEEEEELVEGDLRLVGGDHDLEGRVEVYHDDQWGTVCDDFWTVRNAKVVCRQLGHKGGKAVSRAHFGEGSDPIWLDNVRCEGDEDRLEDCTANDWGSHNCRHSEDAGVSCTQKVGAAPTFTEGASATRSVEENTASGTNIGLAVSATDPDNDTLTYTLGGTNAGSFSIDSSTGQLSTSAELNYELKNSYSVTVSVSDGNGGSDSIEVTINVTDVEEDDEDSLAAGFENMPSSHDGSSQFTFNVRFSEDVAIGFANMRDHAFNVTNGDVEAVRRIDGSSAYWRITVEPDDDSNVTIVLEANRACNVTGAICTSDGDRLSTRLENTVSGPGSISTNQAPVFTEGTSAARSIAENTSSGTAIGSAVSAIDANNDILTYSLGGTDASSFSIDSSTGQLRTSSALDFETKNRYSLSVTASDGNGGVDSIIITINVTNANEAPVFIEGSRTTRSVPENTAVATAIGSAVSATDDDNSDTLTYSLGGTNASSFRIDSSTGQLRTSAALDYETKNNYSVTVSVSDDNGGSDSIFVMINVTNANDAPVFTEESSATRSVAENTAIGTAIGSAVTATDGDSGDTLTYSLGGADASSFRIDSSTGQLSTIANLDFETKNSYSVTVSVSDSNGGSDSITVTINVTDVVGTGEHSSGDLRLVEGRNSSNKLKGRVEIYHDGKWGTVCDDNWDGNDAKVVCRQLGQKGGTAYSRAHFGEGNGTIWMDEVRCSGSESQLKYCTFNSWGDHNCGHNEDAGVSCVDINNEDPVFTEGESATRSVSENTSSGTAIGSAVTATDGNNDILTYTLSGTDAGSFSIDSSTGQLRKSADLDYDTQNSYSVTVNVSDGNGGSDSITVTINVTETEEGELRLVNGDNDLEGRVEIYHNGEWGTVCDDDWDANDAKVVCRQLGHKGGRAYNQAHFGQGNGTIWMDNVHCNGDEARLANCAFPFYSHVTFDSNSWDDHNCGHNEDAGVSCTRDPVFTEGEDATRSVAENTASDTAIGSAVSATDEDNDTLTYTLGGTDASSFSIDSSTGQLSTSSALDYETKHSYSVTVSVSDSNGGSDSIAVTINVTNVAEGDEIILIANLQNIPSSHDGSSQFTFFVVFNADVATSVADMRDHAFNVTNGDIKAAEQIGGSKAHWKITAEPDDDSDVTIVLEAHRYCSTVGAICTSNGDRLSTRLTATVSGPDLITNEDPSFTEGENATRSIAENTASGTTIGSAVSATDEDNDTLTYTLGGTNASSFSIDSSTGQLSTSADLDFETKSSYSVTVSVSDSNGGSDSIAVTINVTNVNEDPSFTEGTNATRSIAENTASGTNIGSAVSATDADNDTLTYTLGGTDAGSFSIDSSTGQLSTSADLDFETKSSYSVTVSVSDSNGGSAEISVTINVTNENEVPTFTEDTSATRSIAENTASGTAIGSAISATDLNSGDTLTYSLGGTDASSFSIDSNTGQLSTSTDLDYETKSRYSVTVSVSDSNGGTAEIEVIINVTDMEIEPAPDQVVQIPWHLSNVTITFPTAPTDIESYCLTMSISGTMPSQKLYIAPFNQHINDIAFYGGLQTHINGKADKENPVLVTRGKGAIFSRWKESHLNAIMQADGGLFESSDHEGNFIGVRNDFEWGVGSYRLCLRKGDTVAGAPLPSGTPPANAWGTYVHTWVKMSATDLSTNETIFMGALAFPGETLSLSRTNGIFVEFYESINTQDVSDLDIVFNNFLIDGEKVRYSEVSDQSNPKDQNSNDPKMAYVSYDSQTQNISMKIGEFKDEHGQITTTHTVDSSIKLNSDVSVFSVSASSSAISEGSSADFVIERSGDTSTSQTVYYEIQDTEDTLVSSSTSGSVTFSASETNKTVSLATQNDAIEENDSIVTLTLKENSAYEISGSRSASLTVQDNGTASFSVSVNSDNVEEGSSSTLTVRITNGVTFSSNQTISLSISGSASSSDYTVSPSTLSLTAGDSSTTASISIVDDSDEEEEETIQIQASHNGSNIGSRQTITIPANDQATVVEETLSDGDLRLVGGDNDLEGRVEVYHNDQWGTVCDDLWGTNDAKVVCRQLGHTGGRAFNRANFGQGSGKIWMDNVACSGNENRLEDCTFNGWDRHNCSHSEDAGVSCTAAVATSNQDPVFTEGTSATRSVAENTSSGTNIGSAVSATDDDSGDTLTYSLGGTNASSFSINSGTGQLSTSSALDFETKNSYSVTVGVSDSNGGSDSIAVTINITDVDETDETLLTAVFENMPSSHDGSSLFTFNVRFSEDVAIGYVNMREYAFDVTNGDVEAARRVNGSSAYWEITVEPDDNSDVTIVLEANRACNVTGAICTSDETRLSTRLEDTVSGPGSISINRAPVFTEGTSATRSIAENTASNTNIGSAVSATDADNNTLTYSLGGTNANSFSINSGTGQLSTNSALDFETKNSYSVTVGVSDSNGGSDSITVTINVTDVDEEREPTSLSDGDLRLVGGDNDLEGRVEVYHDDQWGTVCDDFWGTNDAKVVCRQLGHTGGTAFNRARFGQGSDPIWMDDVNCSGSEAKLKDCSFRGWDRHNCSHSEDAGVSCTAAVATSNQDPVFTEGTSATRSIAENTASGTSIGSAVTATDDDSGDTLTYSLGGTNASSFSINSGTGQLSTSSALDFETKNSYSVTLSVSDSNGGSDSISVTINITDVEEGGVETPLTAGFENMPSSHDGSSLFTFNVRFSEDVAIGFANMRDHAFDVTNGDVEAARRVNGSSAYWEITVEPDDNSDVTIVLAANRDCNVTGAICTSDETRLSTRLEDTVSGLGSISINRAPVFTEGTSATRSIAENTASNTNIGSAVSATDADNNTLTYSLGGTNANSFSINSGTGQLSTSSALDFETKNSYSVTISVSDSNGGSDSIAVTINITDVSENRAPTFTEGTSAIRSIAENTDSDTNIGSAVSATDADNNTLTYSLGGTNANSFSINSGTGQLRTSSALDFETKSSYSVTVNVSDSNGGSDSITVTINVTDVDEQQNRDPVFTEGTNATRSIAENTASNTNIGSAVSATDADNNTLTYSLGGTNANSFSINSGTGQLRTSSALDFETKSSYSVTISVSDSNGGSDSITVTINVTDVDEEREPTSLSDGDLRLVGGNNNLEGRVEIYHNSQWGTICDDFWSFDKDNPKVVCRQLGHTGGTAYSRAHFGEGSDPIWMDNVQCSGNENRLEDCRFNGWGSNNCDHSEDVGVKCSSSASSFAHTEVFIKSHGFNDDEGFSIQGAEPDVDVSIPISQLIDEALQGRHPSELEVLDLMDHKLSDLDGIERLTGLRQLFLKGNLISDLYPLSGLTELRYLDLSDNEITDLSDLYGLHKLERLNLSYNNIENLSPLDRLTNLEVLLVNSNNITDIGILFYLNKLQYLGLAHNQITDITALSNLFELDVITLEGNRIIDLSPLSYMTELRYLDLSENYIFEIDSLAYLFNLEALDLDYNKVSDPQVLSNLSNLMTLSLRSNQLKDIGSLHHIDNLQNLDLRDNAINTSPLLFPNLIWLGADQNKTNISSQSDMRQ